MKKFREQLDKIKTINRTHLLIAGLLGVLLLVIALPTGDQKEEIAEQPQSQTAPQGQTGQASAELSYQRQLEQQLGQILSEMEGVGEVSVMITLKDNGETQVEKDITRTEEKSSESDSQGGSQESSGVSLQEETIYNQTDSSGQTPFVKKTTLPQVEGVLVVAQGAQNATVVKNISDAILALFPVEAHRIKVVRMN